MLQSSEAFVGNAAKGMADAGLQRALARAKPQFAKKRQAAVDKLPEFEALRDVAVGIKNHAIANLDYYLGVYAEAVARSGGVVHWCSTAEDARAAVLKICRDAGARTVTKGKSMVTEEIGLNDYLEANGIEPVETDLGEYILQLRREPPSHIIGPAFHLNREQWEESFREHHKELAPERVFHERRDILTEARGILRSKFLAADVGITGANFLIAETGSSVIVTNEGNGDLTQTLPRVHVVVTSIEKVVPNVEDCLALLRVLARSATGQDMSVYTTFSTGGRRVGDLDGPEQYHVVLLDNGRSGMVGTEFQDMLRCIRCAACMNHCPVYGAVGGHAYGATYPGPMGSVLSPMLQGIEAAHHLPNASTFCGKCESVCPVKIPLPNLMRHWREREFERHLQPVSMRYGLGVWAWFAKRPGLYRLGTRAAAVGLGWLGRKRGFFGKLPLASGWTAGRDFPAPEGDTFFAKYASASRRARNISTPRNK
ncbi:MAG TPA: LutB/LldF family L-lactate oxidation iron-sulfur protein [Acidocella sp.]|nr:MAG: iron-sulfur cluster-binding protein [Acidocella sp. 20-58-15]HQT39971.1 LutB/LldF family L-lactate oxidation iron-sulfur protein [Acidocella sp.]